ncbi:exodeoxyribonuclease III Xth [Paracidovorax avenae ATCC 19860]|uniref:Exodeoxyribonuclease III Xth n=1 Tax=Paracidovorax avenae (strain ATCC 19860 / DSM 7227 / CCUG 15838 / JCM 20985 / LMG 2117 / NCPPB 1011) TaxID=643561 RepID=F0Q6I1_PARA1|nr:exodeoxyribonuclease III [Paracidovorax avenae]ADX46927.1 exodeoxyribonuclease III Xth [Paracidovorax avenae ATCC 19860]
MKIATFNVNSIRARLPALLQWLQETRPGVACLQELKCTDDAFPAEEIRAAGYGALWHGQKAWNGVAILARGAEPIEVQRGLPGDAADTQSRYLEAAVDGVLVACLYLPNGNPAPGPKFDYKLAWLGRLARRADVLRSRPEPVVLAGDFNIIPTERDVYKPDAWVEDALFRTEVRDAFRALVDSGWTDALRAVHPGETVYTFWDYLRQRFQRNAGLRIDHLLLNPAAARRLQDAGVDRDVRGRARPSDHAPAWAVLAPEPQKRRPGPFPLIARIADRHGQTGARAATTRCLARTASPGRVNRS